MFSTSAKNTPVVELYGRMIAPQCGCCRPLHGSSEVCSSIFEADTLQECGGKTSSIELSMILYVSYDLEFEKSSLTFILWKFAVFKVLDYGSHLVIDNSRVIDGLGQICRMDTWLIKEFDRDNLYKFSIFSGCQSGQGICLGILGPQNLMDCVGAKGTQDILSFLEIGRHFLTSRLILVCYLADDELGIAVNVHGFYFHFFGEV